MSDPAGGVPGTPPPAAPTPGGMQWSAGNALSFGWRKVASNFGIVGVLFVAWVLSMFIGLIGAVVIQVGVHAHDGDVAILCMFLGVGLQVIAISHRDTSFPTIRIPDAGDLNPFVQMAAGWNLLVDVGLAAGINLDKPLRARKVGNDFGG